MQPCIDCVCVCVAGGGGGGGGGSTVLCARCIYIMYMPLCACAGVYISICIAKHIAGMWLSCCFLAMKGFS